MRLNLVTPEQAHAIRQTLARVAEWWARIREQLTALARRIGEAARHLVRLAEQARPVLRRPDRPAWASPYGPEPKGHR
ncbi:hypothetical protein OG272_16095 [Streptomyces sp. NBC_00104]|uniref:hypothetical protein n=1 Tax=Streptomyces sp. NBC_00104 TaxID=2903621 RepID=UPI00325651F9